MLFLGGLFLDRALDLEAEPALAQNGLQLGDILAQIIEAARLFERAGLLLEAQVEGLWRASFFLLSNSGSERLRMSAIFIKLKIDPRG